MALVAVEAVDIVAVGMTSTVVMEVAALLTLEETEVMEVVIGLANQGYGKSDINVTAITMKEALAMVVETILEVMSYKDFGQL